MNDQQPTLASVLELADALGPMLEDLTHSHDDSGAAIISFTAVDVVQKKDSVEVRRFDLTVEQAHWYFAGGLGIVGGADLLLALAARDLGAPRAIWAVVGALLIGGSGCAVFNAQITAAAVSSVPPDRAATASAICVTMRQIGFAFGIALIGALLQRRDPYAYTTAFSVLAACTLGLAVLAFALLGRSER